MTTKTTLRYPNEELVLPVQSIKAEVLDGPASGETVETEEETLTVGTAKGNHLILEDETVSRFHLELSRQDDGILVQDHGSTNGTWIGELRVERAVVPPGTTVRLGRCRVKVSDGDRISLEVHDEDSLGRLRGATPLMRRLFARVRKAAQSEVPVLMVGESGTGKELIARAIHDGSKRADGPFVVVDCASLTPTLVASELFGHEKGAFTGAHQRHIGAFERAHGGTVFLDEIGELPEQLQPTLLGVLERRRFRRLGARDEVDVDVRLVAATHRDLRAEVNNGSFRLDLYYRLAVVRLAVPALRERPDDIPVLIAQFLAEAGHQGEMDALIPPAAQAALRRHHWPGNVRELRNYVDAMLAMGEPPELDDLGVEAPAGGPGIALSRLLALPYKEARAAVLHEFESHYLPMALERADGNVSKAARDNAMDRSHLMDLLRRHGLR